MNTYKLTHMGEGTLQAYVQTNFPAIFSLIARAGIDLNTLPAGTVLFLPTLASPACQAALQNVNLAALTREQAAAIILNHVFIPSSSSSSSSSISALTKGCLQSLHVGAHTVTTANGRNHVLQVISTLNKGNPTKAAYIDGQALLSTFVKNGIVINSVDCVLAGTPVPAPVPVPVPVPGPIPPPTSQPPPGPGPFYLDQDDEPAGEKFRVQHETSHAEESARHFYRWLRKEASGSEEIEAWVGRLEAGGNPARDLAPIFAQASPQALVFVDGSDFVLKNHLAANPQADLRHLKSWEGEHKITSLGDKHFDLEIYRRHGNPRMKVNGANVKKYKYYKGDGQKIALLTY